MGPPLIFFLPHSRAQDLLFNENEVANENLSADADSLRNGDVLSSCVYDSNKALPSRLRAGDAVCPPDSSTPLMSPRLPDLDGVEDVIMSAERTRPDPPSVVTI